MRFLPKGNGIRLARLTSNNRQISSMRQTPPAVDSLVSACRDWTQFSAMLMSSPMATVTISNCCTALSPSHRLSCLDDIPANKSVQNWAPPALTTWQPEKTKSQSSSTSGPGEQQTDHMLAKLSNRAPTQLGRPLAPAHHRQGQSASPSHCMLASSGKIASSWSCVPMRVCAHLCWGVR